MPHRPARGAQLVEAFPCPERIDAVQTLARVEHAGMAGQVVLDGNDAGLVTDFYVTTGYWVIEVSVWCSAGTLQGAGTYIDNLPSLGFATTPDIDGNVSAGGTGVRHWSVLVKSEFSGPVHLYAMGNWSAFGPTSAKTLHWLKCGARPATDGEIKALKAGAGLTLVTARVKDTEDTLADLPNQYAAATRATALEAQVNGESESNLLSRANEQASSIADKKVGAVAQTVTTLSASIGGSNLLANTTFASTYGWTFGRSAAANLEAGTDAAGALYHPPGEHVLSIIQGVSVGADAYSEWQSEPFPATTSKSYQYYIFGNSHRSDIDVFIIWQNASGTQLSATASLRNRGPGGTGNTADGYRRLGQLSVKPPAGTVRGVMVFRKYDTDAGQADSYAWGWRAFVAEARDGQNNWYPYSVGTGAAAEGTLVQQAGAIAGVNGRTSVYWSITGSTGDGSTMVQLSKADGSPGLFYVGANMLVSGNLTVDGTITARKFDRNSMSREGSAVWQGSVSPGAGQSATVPWSLSLSQIPGLGRFIYEYQTQINTNVGQRQTTTMNGKPAYLDYVSAGGGVSIVARDNQGNEYRPKANASAAVLATTDFVPSWTATITNGSYDTGWIDQGDYYSRQVAGTYTVTLINLKVTWVAI